MSIEYAAGAAPPRTVDSWSRERRFYTGMAVASILTVFAGFAPSYYLKAITGASTFSGQPVLSPLLHLHGLVFTTWMALFLVQTRLVAARRLALHRRLGYGALGVAVAMVAVGFTAAVEAARRGSAPPGVPPLAFLAIPMADLVIFSTLVAAGAWFRRHGDVHKRLMLASTIAILTPAIARLPGVIGFGPLAFFALTDVFVLAMIVHDRVTLGRVHHATWWAGGLLLASQVGRLAISGTGWWIALATWLTR